MEGESDLGSDRNVLHMSVWLVNSFCCVIFQQSFRFGVEIAYVGATILDVCKRVRKKTLVGGNHQSKISRFFFGDKS